MMNRARSSILLIWLALVLASSALTASDRPNVVFFYADDLGYGDLACYGSPVAQTPHLDQLAGDGTRFTQFYVSHCVCSPTRASAITGQFPGRHRIYSYLSHLHRNRQRKMPDWLDVRVPSLPRSLQQAGYRTAMIGKWHLGGGSGSMYRGRAINHPDAPAVDRYGFDHVRTTFGNSASWKHAQPWPETHDIYPYEDNEWATWSSRAIADETIGFLRDHVDAHKDRPFYINVWLKDVHVPLRPTDAMREPFSQLNKKPQSHYAMVRYMDEQIGRVLEAMEELDLQENTLVLFSSDNGAAQDRGGSNGPLRGWKHGLYEGGIRVPLIVRWPGEVPAGRVDDSSVLNIVDFAPTLCRLTGAEMPDGYVSDGQDMTAALRGESVTRHKPQFWHYPNAGHRSPKLALRDGRWKLLSDPDGGRLQLYDLQEDPGETNNLAPQQPDRTETLKTSLLDWYRQLPLASDE